MRYLGSKTGTLGALEQILPTAHGPTATFADPFGGIGVVGSHFRSLGYVVHSSDLLSCANTFQVARLRHSEPPLPAPLTQILPINSPEDLVRYLTNLPGRRGWITTEFALKRSFFTVENAVQIDAARIEIERLRTLGLLASDSYKYYMACLISAADEVANTAGTYYAFLKEFDRKALRRFQVRLLKCPTGPLGMATIEDAYSVVARQYYDVLYLDPPYNSRDYAGYYHLPETIATRRTPDPYGKSGVDRAPRPRSQFTHARTASNALAELVAIARCRTMVLHYSDRGLIPRQTILKTLRKFGAVEEHVVTTAGYSSSGTRRDNHRVYVVTP